MSRMGLCIPGLGTVYVDIDRGLIWRKHLQSWDWLVCEAAAAIKAAAQAFPRARLAHRRWLVVSDRSAAS